MQRRQRSSGGDPGGDAVVNEDDRATFHSRGRAVPAVEPDPARQLLPLCGDDRREVFRQQPQRPERAQLEHGFAALGDRPDAVLRLPRQADLAGHEHIGRYAEHGGGVRSDDHAAAGEAQHHRVIQGETGQLAAEQVPGLRAIGENPLRHAASIPRYARAMSTRRIPASAFSGDDGAADTGLVAALALFAADPARRPDVLAALHRARILAPVVARPDQVATGAAGLVVDKTSDISVPLLEGTDGRRALPVFTGLDSLARWDPAARPVPVDGPRAARVADAEGAEVLVVDVAGPDTCVLAAPELRALVDGRGVVPAYDDDRLATELGSVLAAEPRVSLAWLLPAPDVDARLTLGLVDDAATDGELTPLLARLARRVADLPRWAAHGVRGLDVALAAAADVPAGRPVFRRLLD
jgi:hypothetical protein